MVEEFLEALDLCISEGHVRLEAFVQDGVCQNLQIDDLTDYLENRLAGRFDSFEIIHATVVDILSPGLFGLNQEVSIMHERV